MNRKIRGIENSAWESSRPGGGREILHLAHTIAATTCTDSSLFLWRGLGDRMTTRGKKRWERSADNSWFTGGWWQQHTSGRRRASRRRHGRTLFSISAWTPSLPFPCPLGCKRGGAAPARKERRGPRRRSDHSQEGGRGGASESCGGGAGKRWKPSLVCFCGLCGAAGSRGLAAQARFTIAGCYAAYCGYAVRVCPAGWRLSPPRLHPYASVQLFPTSD